MSILNEIAARTKERIAEEKFKFPLRELISQQNSDLAKHAEEKISFLERPLRHVVRQTLLQIARAVKIGKALGQVYGLMLLGQGAHLGKNRGAECRKFTLWNQGVIVHSFYTDCNAVVEATITRC